SSRRRHTRSYGDWSSDVCSSDLRYMRRVVEGFTPVPIKTSPLFDHEVVGLEALGQMGAALYGGEDPTTIYFEGRTQVLEALPGEIGRASCRERVEVAGGGAVEGG